MSVVADVIGAGAGVATGMDGLADVTSPMLSRTSATVGVMVTGMDGLAGAALVARSTKRMNLGPKNVSYVKIKWNINP